MIIGRYEIVAPLGAGGMGEVYRARDLRIGRDVALKTLPDVFASDDERIARFEREARVLGSLNHQNIAAIYGVEQVAGSETAPPVLVMELVEGPTLADRIASGPIQLREALTIAAQIAEALDAAHDQGIVHRDLKPANIKLRPDETVKVLDFGLAKIADPADSSQLSATAASSPTFSLAGSRVGMILGTAAYMAPEQARGRPVDKRADVWAFGVVLYEMLTGTRAFAGEDVSDTLASVIKFDPDWTKLPSETPAPIRRLLKRCLAKDVKQRLRDLGSALLDIREAQSVGSSDTVEASRTTDTAVRRRWLPLVTVAALGVATGAAAWAWLARPVPPAAAQTRRFTITLPESDTLPAGIGALLTIAPDGRTLVYRAERGGVRQLFRRSIDQFDSTEIAGTDDAAAPRFSPDGAWLFFEATASGRLLKRMPATGGPVQTLTTLANPTRGLSWTPDGRLLFGLSAAGGSLMQLPAAGGAATALLELSEQRRAAFPFVLGDGSAVLFSILETALDPGKLHALRLDTSEQKPVLGEALAARVLPTGHLIFIRAGTLWAVPFDEERLETRGTPVPVVEGVRIEAGGAIQYDVAADGTLVYVPGAAGTSGQRTLQFAGADGKLQPVPTGRREFVSVRLSPDGTRVAAQVEMTERADVWVVDVARGTATRLTTEAGYDGSPIWSPDGRSVVFISLRGMQVTLNRRAADGTGPIEQLAAFGTLRSVLISPTTWTSDGGLMLTVEGDVMLLPPDSKGELKPVIRTPARETQAAVSPDGRWLAYASDETGVSEVYLQRYPSLSDRQLVSVGGGIMPVWSPDGRKVIFLQGGPPRDIMAVAIGTTGDGVVRVSTPSKIGDWRYYSTQGAPRPYDVTRDERLLVIGLPETGIPMAHRQIHVVVNWFEELKRLVPLA
jgi:serine/threonine-protein kinase